MAAVPGRPYHCMCWDWWNSPRLDRNPWDPSCQDLGIKSLFYCSAGRPESSTFCFATSVARRCKSCSGHLPAGKRNPSNSCVIVPPATARDLSISCSLQSKRPWRQDCPLPRPPNQHLLFRAIGHLDVLARTTQSGPLRGVETGQSWLHRDSMA